MQAVTDNQHSAIIAPERIIAATRGEFRAAGDAYAAAAERANDKVERDHLIRRSARARARSGNW